MLVVFVCVFINVLVSAPSGYDDLILAGMFIIAVIATSLHDSRYLAGCRVYAV